MTRIYLIPSQPSYPTFADSTYNLMSQIHTVNTFSILNTNTKMQACQAKYMKNRLHFLEFDISGRGLYGERPYSKFCLRVEGSIRGQVLIERGA